MGVQIRGRPEQYLRGDFEITCSKWVFKMMASPPAHPYGGIMKSPIVNGCSKCGVAPSVLLRGNNEIIYSKWALKMRACPERTLKGE